MYLHYIYFNQFNVECLECLVFRMKGIFNIAVKEYHKQWPRGFLSYSFDTLIQGAFQLSEIYVLFNDFIFFRSNWFPVIEMKMVSCKVWRVQLLDQYKLNA